MDTDDDAEAGLEAHQKSIAQFFVANPGRSLLLAHGMGTGKTRAALAAARVLRHRVRLVAPLATHEQWEAEARAMGVPIASYDNYTSVLKWHGRQMRQGISGCTLILDEAHNIKNMDAKSTAKLLRAAKFAANVLACTGTPMPNMPEDFLVYQYLLTKQQNLMSASQFKAALERDRAQVPAKNDTFRQVASGLASFYYPDNQDPNFPEKKQKYISVQLTAEEDAAYEEEMQNKVDPFYSGSRQALLSRKFEAIISHMLKHDTERHVVYSNYVDSGVAKMKQQLERTGRFQHADTAKSPRLGTGKGDRSPSIILYDFITGAMPPADRYEKIKRYNEGKVDVLLISPALAEGVTLKRTRYMHVMDPSWTQAETDQITARVARYKSHEGVDDPKVTIRHYIVERFDADQKSVDQILLEKANKKDELIRYYMHQLGTISIESLEDEEAS